MTRVAGLVLAAGAARRLGVPKHTLRRGGRSYAALAVAALREGGCDAPVLVVLRPGTELPQDCDALPVVNPGSDEGMGSSLRLGLEVLAGGGVPHQPAAVVVTLVDTPAVGPEHVRRLVAAHGAGAPPRPLAVVAAYEGVRRTPALLARPVWDAVAAGAQGEVGARAWLDAHPDLVRPVECSDLGPWADVDTPADLAGRG